MWRKHEQQQSNMKNNKQTNQSNNKANKQVSFLETPRKLTKEKSKFFTRFCIGLDYKWTAKHGQDMKTLVVMIGTHMYIAIEVDWVFPQTSFCEGNYFIQMDF